MRARPFALVALSVVCFALVACGAPAQSEQITANPSVAAAETDAPPAATQSPPTPTASACDVAVLQRFEPVAGSSVLVNQPDKAYEGITVFLPRSEGRIVGVDMLGNVVFEYRVTGDEEFPAMGIARPRDNLGVAYYAFRPYENRPLNGKFVEVDGEGDVRFEWYGGEDMERVHHDFALLDNGNALILVSPLPNAPVEGLTDLPVRNDVILEVTPGGEVVWQWDTSQHIDQLQLSDVTLDTIARWGTGDVGNDNPFTLHTNAIQVLPPNKWQADHPEFAQGNLLVSQRRSGRVFVIDRDSGDVVWILQEPTIGQHQARMIPEGLPGAGNILIFDNGNSGNFSAPERPYSRVIEVNPVTQQVVWQYDAASSGEDVNSFYAGSRSGIQRLPNGNTLIADAPGNRIFEVTVEGEIVWDYRFESQSGFFRAYRLPVDWACGGVTGFADPFPW